MVFIPLRLVSLRDGKLQILRIPFTYLQVESVEGPEAQVFDHQCDARSAFEADGSAEQSGGAWDQAGKHSTFASLCDQARSDTCGGLYADCADGPERTTARSGNDRSRWPHRSPAGICERPGHFAACLPATSSRWSSCRSCRANSRPDEQPIAFDPKPLTVALESRIDSLRDEVVDLVALRARLEMRMKARLDGEDWSALDATIKEFAKLTPREEFVQQLSKLKDDAAQEQAKLKTAILTKTAQAQISDLQSMIDRYLDDDTYSAYVDALERAQAELTARDKAKTKKATGAAKPAAPKANAKTAGGKTAAPQDAAEGAAPVPKAAPEKPKATVPF